MADDPSKQETEHTFTVLRSQRANRACFDCNARNPTWASVSFAVYICLECSSNHRNMGVHISFVRSTNLDSWQLNQLRTMKVGGNASASDFFSKHGGSSLLSDSDTKKKYSSRVAELYKEELARRVKDDISRFPNRISVDGIEHSTQPKPADGTAEDEDFFTSWSKPNTPKNLSASNTPARVATPPVLGRAASASSTSTTTTTSTSTAAATPSPRTITSSSASARPARLGAGTSRLASSTSTTSSTTSTTTASSNTAAKKGKGLGAQRAKPVDFAAAERKAREEEERIKQLGYDRQREEAEEKARKDAEAVKKAQEIGPQSKSTTTATTTNNKPQAKPQQNAAFPRLGFGAIPGAGAAAAVAATSVTTSTTSSKSTTNDDAPTIARDRFGNQKGISSDMYFERNAYDPVAAGEARTRLQTFQGATSISSNQYFGRDEEDEDGNGMNRGDGGMLGDGSLAGLESAAKDAVSRILANPDVQNVGESIRAGALKLSDYLASMSMDR